MNRVDANFATIRKLFYTIISPEYLNGGPGRSYLSSCINICYYYMNPGYECGEESP